MSITRWGLSGYTGELPGINPLPRPSLPCPTGKIPCLRGERPTVLLSLVSCLFISGGKKSPPKTYHIMIYFIQTDAMVPTRQHQATGVYTNEAL